MRRPWIVEVHLRVSSHSWKNTCSRVVAALKDDNRREFSLTPFYVNSDVADNELRICLQFSDPVKLGKFIVEKIRSIKGVEATRVRLTLMGEIFPEGVKTLASGSPWIPCHIFVDTPTGRDKQTWNALRRLKKEAGVLPVWIFRDFYEYDRGITLRLVGKNKKLLRQYAQKYLGRIKGIDTWQLRFMHSATYILSKNKLLKIAKNWFYPE